MRSKLLSKRRWVVLGAMWALVAGVPAFAQKTVTLGTVTASPETGTPSNGLTGDFKRASKITLTEQGILRSIGAFVDGNGGGSGRQQLRYVLYRDAGGYPGTKVTDAAPYTVGAGDAPQWWDAPVPAPELFGAIPAGVLLDPGSYWIAIQSDSIGAGVARDYSTGTAQNWYGNTDLFSDGASDAFGTGSLGIGTLEVRLQYWPTAGLSSFGRTDVGTVASTGLSADYKRASKFVLSERATLVGLNAYIDASGGGSGRQKLKMVLYRDDGGVPGAEVVTSSEASIGAGQVHGWVFFPAASAALDPGAYWIAIHSAGTGGVVRDYGDGAANWYGNSDSYSDGASNPFGTGSSGTETLSVSAFYQPGYTITQPDASTTVWGTPSSGLTANYIRGSSISSGNDCISPPTSQWPWPATVGVTGFSVYLDGNGGASGSQAVRTAWYHFNTSAGGNNVPTDKVAESGSLDIPAGMPPSWVLFPLSTTVPWDGTPVILGIQTGDVGGIARDFGASEWWGTWFGAPAPFAQGAPNPWPAGSSQSDTQLSTYMNCVVLAPWWTVPSQ